MPKLAAKHRKQVKKAEATGGGFDPIPAGKYVATLNAVEAKNSNAGNPMWVAEFTEITGPDGETQPGRQWLNLMLPTTDEPPEGYVPGGKEKDPQKAWTMFQDMCAGRLKQFFEVFGYSEDSDTDEMLQEKCIIQIGIRTIQKGPKAGTDANQVNGIEALDSVPWGEEVAEGGGGGGEDEF